MKKTVSRTITFELVPSINNVSQYNRCSDIIPFVVPTDIDVFRISIQASAKFNLIALTTSAVTNCLVIPYLSVSTVKSNNWPMINNVPVPVGNGYRLMIKPVYTNASTNFIHGLPSDTLVLDRYNNGIATETLYIQGFDFPEDVPPIEFLNVLMCTIVIEGYLK
jgi:hypothetical protein